MAQNDCQTQSPVESDRSGVPAGSHSLPTSWVVRGTWLFAGVVLPFFCFLITYPENPRWQSGELSAYAQLLLSRKPSYAQYPFLLYSMTSMFLLIFRPDRFWNSTFVCLGIFSGVIVAAEYWLIFQFACCDATEIVLPMLLSAAAVVVPWLLGRLLAFLVRKFGYGVVGAISALLALPLLLFFWVPAFICLWCSTPWALASYLAVSMHLVRRGGAARFRFSLGQLLLALGWLSASFGAWRLSFIVMLREYAALPLAPPPQCFVCTAAANGHPRMVRSENYLGPNGATFRVNDQLRSLKAFELLLVSVSPRLHRLCRCVYDRVGPRLAATLVHPALADLGYLVLKPAEWVARVCLALVIPGDLGLVRRIYRTHGSSEAAK